MSPVMSTPNPVKKSRPDGWWYPWIFVGGFAIVIAVNSVLAWFATNTWTGLDGENPFKEGLAYNQVLDERARQRELGWNAELTFIATPTDGATHGGMATVTLNGTAGAIVGADVSAQVVRPIGEGLDQTVTFHPRGNGAYVARLDLPQPGQWELRIEAKRGYDVFKLRQRIQVP